jgi:hypothetical protein
VVSIKNGAPLDRMMKVEYDGWGIHNRLRYVICIYITILYIVLKFVTVLLLCFSIEDPFETWYDIGHVIKGAQMIYMRKEFMV